MFVYIVRSEEYRVFSSARKAIQHMYDMYPEYEVHDSINKKPINPNEIDIIITKINNESLVSYWYGIEYYTVEKIEVE